jgi:2-methylcitrate dehydratase PrpD
MAEDGVKAERVTAVRFRVPPLTARLISRPVTVSMTPGYARLCLQYVGAVCLRRGTVGLDDFTAAALTDPQTLALARRLQIIEDGNPDPNALIPRRVEIGLVEGRTVACSVDAVLGSPTRPLAADAVRAKFGMCWREVAQLRPEHGVHLWNAASALEALEDVRVLAALAAPSRGN